MKTKLLAIIAVSALISACSTTGSNSAGFDTDKMRAVEYAAQKTGTDIIWVHPPIKKKENK